MEISDIEIERTRQGYRARYTVSEPAPDGGTYEWDDTFDSEEPITADDVKREVRRVSALPPEEPETVSITDKWAAIQRESMEWEAQQVSATNAQT